MMRSEVSLDLQGSWGVALSQEMSPAAMITGKFGVGAGVGTGVGPEGAELPPQAYTAIAPQTKAANAEQDRILMKGAGRRIPGSEP